MATKQPTTQAGARIALHTANDRFTLSPTQEAALLESIAQIDQGDFVTLDALLKSLPALNPPA